MHWSLIYTILTALLRDKQRQKLSPAEVDARLALILHEAPIPQYTFGAGTYEEQIEKRSRIVLTGSLAIEWSNTLYEISQDAPAECVARLAESARFALETTSQMIYHGQDEYSGLAAEWIKGVSDGYDRCATPSSPPKPRTEPLPRTAADIHLLD